MRFETPQVQGWLIGDTHFGKDFRNGCPLHRRGERERLQLAQFKEELATPDVTKIIMVGDLVDKPFVPLPVINEVAHAILNAAMDRPDVEFVFLAGNHDKSRQLNVRGAWEILELAIGWQRNIITVNEPLGWDGLAFYPWQWDKPALDQVFEYEADALIGHWDLRSYGGDDSHLCPTQALLEAHGPDVTIYSGHYHEEGIFNVDGINVNCTGSLQPFSHGEDPDGQMYVTLSLDEALAQAEELRDKCVRVVLARGEDLPQIDCLQLSYMREGSDEEIEIEVGLGNFDIHAVLENEFNENEVPTSVRDFIKERLGAFA